MILFSSHGALADRLPDDDRTDFQAKNTGDEEALLTLARLGFVRRAEPGAGWRWSGEHPAADRALLSLLARFDLRLEIGMAADEAVCIAVATEESSPGTTGGDAFSGTGFRPDDAIRTCLGEFAEFQSWLYRPGDSARRCDRHAVGEQAIDPWDILGFAPAQCAEWRHFNAEWTGYDAVPAPAAFAGEIDWVAAAALSDGAARFVPAQVCFGRYGERADRADKSWRGDSNGCAAGRTKAHAAAHALLELVERDATGIWWYGQISRPAMARAMLDGDPLGAALAARERIGQSVRLLDLTHDLDIPVVAATLTDQGGNLLALGFGCSVDRLSAARSAYRELCQMELSIAFARRRVERDGDAAALVDRRLLDWLAKAGRLPHLQVAEGQVARRPPDVALGEAEAIELLHDRLRRAGLDACIVDLQRPDIGVPAVRAFVPGLCHFKPRFGVRRLTEVPRALRWRETGFSVKDLNALPLLI
jgi:ribosomal protein S12 methylthiotransferase accessory factor